MKHIHDISMDKRLPKPVVYQTSISDMFVQFEKLGKNVVAGSPYSQVIPNPHNDTYGVSREFMALMKKVAGPIDYRSFEGYISAKVAVQGLMKSKAISRSEIRSTLEHLGSFDLGGFSVTYYPGSRIGSSFAELVSVNSTGKMIH